MALFPSIGHVAVTVTDLRRSTRWYTRLFDAEPVLDEDEMVGKFHHTVFALEGRRCLACILIRKQRTTDSTSIAQAWTMSRSRAVTAPGWNAGPYGWTNWVLSTGESQTPTTAPVCPSEIPTESRWSFSRHPSDPRCNGCRGDRRRRVLIEVIHRRPAYQGIAATRNTRISYAPTNIVGAPSHGDIHRHIVRAADSCCCPTGADTLGT